MRTLRWIGVLLAGVALAGCGLLPDPGQRIHIDNMTNTPAALHVNGRWVGTYAPGASGDVPVGGLGEPPFLVTVHSPSGRELARFEVSANDIQSAAKDMGGSSVTVHVGCGTIRLAFGPIDLGPVLAQEPGRNVCL